MKRALILFFVLAYFFVGNASGAAHCSYNKPDYIDGNGFLLKNYCFGPDKKVGNGDDCGCQDNHFCSYDGSCVQEEDYPSITELIGKDKSFFSGEMQDFMKGKQKSSILLQVALYFAVAVMVAVIIFVIYMIRKTVVDIKRAK